jgi:hypothetical protein
MAGKSSIHDFFSLRDKVDLTLQLPRALFSALASAAEEKGRPLEELARNLLGFYLIPLTLKKKVDEGDPLDDDENEVLQEFREYFGTIQDIIFQAGRTEFEAIEALCQGHDDA